MCVLLVEDETLISTIMTECLTEAGYDVIQAADGESALRVIAHPPHGLTVLVTDIHLAEGPNGIDVATTSRRRFPALPVIVATGRPDALAHLPPGALEYRLLPKPYRPGELLAALDQLVGPGPNGPGGGRVHPAAAV